MRAFIAVLFSLFFAMPCLAVDAASGRWQGRIDVPGRPLYATADLDRNPAGVWIGSIIIPELNMKGALLSDISFNGNDITFAIKNATTQFVIVGKKTTDVPVDLVRQDAALLVVQSSAHQMTYEGRYRKETGEIIGTFTQGPFDLPLNLRREK